MSKKKFPEQDMVINVENTDEIRWNVTNGHLTIQLLNKGYRSAHIEPINDMKDPVRATLGLLELCASEMDKAKKLKGKNTSEVLMVDFMNNLTEQIKENGDEKFRRIVYNLYRGPDGKEGWDTYEIAKLFGVELEYVEHLIASCAGFKQGVKRKSGRYPWKQKTEEDAIRICSECGSKHFYTMATNQEFVWCVEVYDEYEGWRNILGWYSSEEEAEKAKQEAIDEWDPARLERTTLQYEVNKVEV